MGLLRSRTSLLLGLLLLATAVGYESSSGAYDNEQRLQMEADVPLAAIGRARRFVAEGCITDSDEIDLQFVLKRDSEAVQELHQVRPTSERLVVCIIVRRSTGSIDRLIDRADRPAQSIDRSIHHRIHLYVSTRP